MWGNNKKAISEVNAILKQLSKESLDKIPKKLLNEIENNATVNTDYIKPELPLDNLPLEEETKEILAVICYHYFCNEAERSSWNQELEENEKKYQENLREKYNPDNLFKINENKETEPINEEQALVEYKEPFFKKIWNILKKWLKKE